MRIELLTTGWGINSDKRGYRYVLIGEVKEEDCIVVARVYYYNIYVEVESDEMHDDAYFWDEDNLVSYIPVSIDYRNLDRAINAFKSILGSIQCIGGVAYEVPRLVV